MVMDTMPSLHPRAVMHEVRETQSVKAEMINAEIGDREIGDRRQRQWSRE
jgi:hypothetical protein